VPEAEAPRPRRQHGGLPDSPHGASVYVWQQPLAAFASRPDAVMAQALASARAGSHNNTRRNSERILLVICPLVPAGRSSWAQRVSGD
jgi:hypothetical protein